MQVSHKYNYFYKITNKLNGFYYYGVHSTDNLNDGYMGSGHRLRKAYKKYGIENFSKEILRFFDNAKDAYEYEADVVTEELVLKEECYNQKLGGWSSTAGMVTVIDKDGNTFNVYKNDPRYLSGELVGVTTGRTVIVDEDGIPRSVYKDDPLYEKYLSGILSIPSKNKVAVRDNRGRYFSVSTDDPRYLSGELVCVWKDKKHSDESKRKIGDKNSIHQTGSGNSQYGTCWIKNDSLKLTKRINRDELEIYTTDGWVLGRCMKYKNVK